MADCKNKTWTSLTSYVGQVCVDIKTLLTGLITNQEVLNERTTWFQQEVLDGGFADCASVYLWLTDCTYHTMPATTGESVLLGTHNGSGRIAPSGQIVCANVGNLSNGERPKKCTKIDKNFNPIETTGKTLGILLEDATASCTPMLVTCLCEIPDIPDATKSTLTDNIGSVGTLVHSDGASPASTTTVKILSQLLANDIIIPASGDGLYLDICPPSYIEAVGLTVPNADPAGGWINSGVQVVIPKTGRYQISATIDGGSCDGNVVIMTLGKNGVQGFNLYTEGQSTAGTTGWNVNNSLAYTYSQGDVLEVLYSKSSGLSCGVDAVTLQAAQIGFSVNDLVNPCV